MGWRASLPSWSEEIRLKSKVPDWCLKSQVSAFPLFFVFWGQWSHRLPFFGSRALYHQGPIISTNWPSLAPDLPKYGIYLGPPPYFGLVSRPHGCLSNRYWVLAEMNSRNAMWVCRVYNIFLTPAHDWIHNCIQEWNRNWDPALNTSAVWPVGPQRLPGISHVQDGVWVGRVQGMLVKNKMGGWLGVWKGVLWV